MTTPEVRQETVANIDFETRSRCDLFACGAYVYAQHPSTEIICLAYAFDDGEPELWTPEDPFPEALALHIEKGAPRSIHAANTQFERLIIKHVLPKYVDFKQPPLEAFYCSLAQARARALPGNLDDLGRCLGLSTQKDKRGKELIRLLSVPQKDTGDFRYDEDLLEEMYDYCLTDVIVERAAGKLTPPLTDTEFADFIVNEKVNDRGLHVDTEFALAATAYAEDEVAEISRLLTEATDGVITSPKQFQRIKDFMTPEMEANDAVRKAMTVHKTDRRTGETTKKIVMDRDARNKLMLLEEDRPGTLSPEAKELISLCDEAGRSSVVKYRNMSNRAGEDGRVRGAYIFSGAGQTGRFSSVGLQVHNLPRLCADPDDIDGIREDVIGNYELEGGVMDTLASMLRPSIMAAPGNTLVWGDWSAIEARVLPWLADTEAADKVLDVFEANDADPSLPDIYMVEYENAYGVPAGEVTKEQRAVGKVIVLSLGYQGGRRALQAMARAYRVSIDNDEAERLKNEWRANNPWAGAFWRDLEKAAKDAVSYTGQEFHAGAVTYCKPEDDAPLYCLLPSGRVLSYPKPKVEQVDGRFGPTLELSAIKAQWKPLAGEDEWGRVGLYGGLLAENVTQATAADILRNAMREIDGLDWPLTFHTHDEIGIEVPLAEADECAAMLKEEMERNPAWADGLPLVAEIERGERYRK